MQKTVLGRTGLVVSRTAFGCLPIQRVALAEAVVLLQKAYEGGINFFDTARAYTDSEEKIGLALSDVRKDIILATKTMATNVTEFWRQLETSLEKLQTDYIDIYQFHNPTEVPMPGMESGLYEAALDAKAKGLIKHIGITQHALPRALEAVRSGLYETVQYPFNHLATDAELALLSLCAEENVGFICMKALSGGLITDASLPFAFIRRFPQAVPIWGFQREAELLQLLSFEKNEPVYDQIMEERIHSDQEVLAGSFCRCCGYCLPCPVGIPIHQANRMKQILTRMPSKNWLTPEWQIEMRKIEKCTKCGQCARRCPYGLKPYETLPDHMSYYFQLIDQQ